MLHCREFIQASAGAIAAVGLPKVAGAAAWMFLPRLLMQHPMPLLEPGDHPSDRGRIGIDLAQVSDLALALAVSHRVPGFRYVQPNINFAMLRPRPVPRAEERPAPYEQPR